MNRAINFKREIFILPKIYKLESEMNIAFWNCSFLHLI